MDLNGKRIILASGSPRRRELLAGLDISFEVDTRNSFEEAYSADTPHRLIPELMSKGKSHGFHRQLEENEILITSDTMVLCGTEVLGKPHSREDAVRMLEMLSGHGHEVITAVTIRTSGREITFSDTTKVFFSPLSEEDIEFYVDRFRPFDKAGAYGIQEWIGYAGIESIEGSFYTVMGLPTHLVYRHLKDFL
ncbi:MAG: septum formation protein Maf [Bacteroidales bacterium]|nr:septum formation protein Maf [Bacteroidales bacterium]